MASYFTLYAQRKVTKRKGTPISLPYGFPHHSPLPAGRPDSRSGLNRTKSDFPVVFALPKTNGSANFKGTRDVLTNRHDKKYRNLCVPLCPIERFSLFIAFINKHRVAITEKTVLIFYSMLVGSHCGFIAGECADQHQ